MAAQSGNYLDEFGNLKLPLDSPIPDYKINMRPMLPDVANTKLVLNVPNVRLTFFDNLKIGLLDFSDALKDLKPRFESLGNSVGRVIANFDRLGKNIGKFLGFISDPFGIGKSLEARETEKDQFFDKDADYYAEADKNGLSVYGFERDFYVRNRRKGLSQEDSIKYLHKPFPKRATGGIFSKAHLAMIGEAGPEAIIPLKRSKRSLGLLDTAAGALGVGATSGPQTIHKTFSPSITVNVNGSPTEGVGQLVAEAVLEALQKAQEEDYRRVAG